MTTNVSIQKADATRRTAKMAGDPSAGGTKGLYFDNGDSLVLSIDSTSFGAGARFTSITFFPTSDESVNASGQVSVGFAGTSPGLATRTIAGRRVAGGPQTNMFTLSWTPTDLTRPITITDIEGNANNDCGWFSLVITDSSGSVWTMDPELVNTSGATPGWQPVKPATMSQMVAI